MVEATDAPTCQQAVVAVVGQHELQAFHLDAAERVLKKVQPDAGKLAKVRRT